MNEKNLPASILAENDDLELDLHGLRLIEAGFEVRVLGAGRSAHYSGKGYAVQRNTDNRPGYCRAILGTLL